jgi:enamine deaminase RidA (YjgF/YER057c/UK114 family)
MSLRTRVRAAIAIVLCLIVALCVAKGQTPAAGKIQRIPIPNSDFPISLGVWVPAGSDTLYLSGNVPPVVNASAPKGSVESYGGNTEAQSVATLQRIQQALESQKLALADVVMMHVYLVGDPSKDNKMDFAGFMAGYTKYFGTKEQPNKPARSALQVAALAAPGVLLEIEVIAVRPH